MMRINLLKILLICLVLPINAIASPINPWISAEASWKHLPFESAFGDHHFQHNYYAPTLTVGLNFLEYFSIEAGWSKSIKRNKNTLYFLPGTVLGFDLDNILENQLHLASSRYDTWQVTFNGEYFFCPRFSGFLAAGVTFMRLSFQTIPIGSLTVFDNPPVEWNTPRKGIARAGAGLKYYLTSRLGVLTSLFWEDTSRLQAQVPADEALFPPISQSDFYTVRAKDSTVASIGLFYQWCPQHFI